MITDSSVADDQVTPVTPSIDFQDAVAATHCLAARRAVVLICREVHVAMPS
jgi:hypothetical protein